jgi:short-subunit dehydrogenase
MTIALVTGASSGIGKELAIAFAARGYDLILTARRKDRLNSLAKQLVATHGVKADVFPLDLSVAGALGELERAVRAAGLSVDVLVNNAGFGTNGRVADENRAGVAGTTP